MAISHRSVDESLLTGAHKPPLLAEAIPAWESIGFGRCPWHKAATGQPERVK
ncbi:MAG: hypothetical protein N2645_20120 [Clostridia bacterium]|nr:hypothetical protein [Clostridia bacterium]